MDLKIAICDDEAIICDEITRLLNKINPDYETNIFYSGQQLMDSGQIFDLIFLDIDMPELNGMDTAKMLRENNNEVFIIFLTSHIEFVHEAFKVRAFRFLNKPIQQVDFFEAVTEAEKELVNNKKIAVDIKHGTKLVNIKDIVCIEAFGDGTYIYTVSDVLESNKSLKYWLKNISTEYFCQVHRAFIIAFRHIDGIGKEEVKMCHMKMSVPVSRRNKKDFHERFLSYVKRK